MPLFGTTSLVGYLIGVSLVVDAVAIHPIHVWSDSIDAPCSFPH